MSKEKITTVITDLDGCLWEGTLAEMQDVYLNKEYHSCLKDLYNKGIQLFVVSKNEPDEVHQKFYSLGISYTLFTEVIANWEPKYLNIEKLLHQTKIRPETVIYIDDNPLELNEVKTKFPSIKCVNIIEWTSALKSDYFKSLKTQSSSEIQERINRYKTAISSSKLKENIKEDESFLKLLNRKMAIREISLLPDVERFAKLLALTHRINFNPEKFNDPDEALKNLEERIAQGEKLYGVSVWENDLSLGLSGGFVVKLNGQTAIIEDATFSCGIMGRDFEQRAIVELINHLREFKIEKITFSITPTSTNLRVKEILNELEFQKSESKNGRIYFGLKLNKYKPSKKYEWIEIIDQTDFSEHTGVPTVINFFDENVFRLFLPNKWVINLGAGRSEVIGHLLPERREIFYEVITNNQILYTKVDLERIPEEDNIGGNAEDLKEVIKDESQDLVMAIELLEHTEHFWKVIDEMIRICKVGGHIFITVPSFNYPKHEYPIDLWRIGPATLLSFFPEDNFELVKFLKEGDKRFPRRLLLLVRKKSSSAMKHNLPRRGKIDWKTGLTYFQ